MSRRAVVLGDALLDVRVAPAEPIRPGADVPARIELLPGGQGANVAVRLARRGWGVELVAALGGDPAGVILRAALEGDGVMLRDVAVPSTGTVVAITEAGGERTMLSHRAPFGHLVLDLETDATWLVVSGYLLTEPIPTKLARAVGASSPRRVILGCALPSGSAGDWLEAARTMKPDIVVLNEAELEQLGTTDGLGVVAVTAANGARVEIDGRSTFVVAPPGPPALDSTGAGDAFAAALLASLGGASWPPTVDRIQAALTEAVEVAGSVARVPGAQGRVADERSARQPA